MGSSGRRKQTDPAGVLSPEIRGMPERLRRALNKANMTQLELSERSGVSQGNISKILSGERPNVTADTVIRFAKALGVDYAWLLAGVGDAPPRMASVS